MGENGTLFCQGEMFRENWGGKGAELGFLRKDLWGDFAGSKSWLEILDRVTQDFLNWDSILIL